MFIYICIQKYNIGYENRILDIFILIKIQNYGLPRA